MSDSRGAGADDPGVDPAAAWASLVATALLGTDRAGSRPLELPGPVLAAGRAVGLDLHEVDPATVLAAAALLDVARTAGRRHPVDDATPVPEAPPEVRPVARTSRAVVARLLAGPAEEREEWLDLLRERGLVVPPHALPGLLRLAVTDDAVRSALGDVLGARGRWLADLDPGLDGLRAAWAGPDDPDDGQDPDHAYERQWRLGDVRSRVRWLRAARRRDPAAARLVLAEAWAGPPAAERADLLGALAVGLADGDEELLERALDDRAAAPRRVAADLLARLPRSAFAERARRRAAGHVRVARIGLRRRLVLDLPEQPFDAAALRDGLVEPTGEQLMVQAPGVRGRGAQRAYQLLVAAPLDTWVPALAPTPADLLRLPVADDRAVLVHTALAEAVQRAGDRTWAPHLLPLAPLQAQRLVPLLDLAGRTRVVTDLLRGRPDDRAHARLLLSGWPRPWPDQLADAVVGAIRRTPVDASYGERAVTRELALLLGHRADARTFVVDPGEDPHLQQVGATLADRRQMTEETTA